MGIERAKTFARIVINGNGTLKKAALVEILETLLEEIDRLEGAQIAEQANYPDQKYAVENRRENNHGCTYDPA